MEDLNNGKRQHKLTLNCRKDCTISGVVDVLSFDVNEILLETEQGMLNVKGKDLHVNRLNLEKGEVDIEGVIDALSYSQVPTSIKKPDNLFGKWFK